MLDELTTLDAASAPSQVAGRPLVARGLTKRFGGSLALDHVDLDVTPGRVLGYLGPNGAGKTTTMRLLMGMLRPTSGSASIFGADVWRQRSEVHRRVGYLPGDFTAYPDLTGAQYLDHLDDLRGGVSRDAAKRLARRFDLDLHRPIRTLSHGNKQKVGLVQAFMHEPDLLLLDEPTIGLDPFMQREFASLVDEVRDRGATMILSSHVLDEVEAIADDVAMIRDGRLVVVDSVASLKARAMRHLELTFSGEPPVDLLRRVPGVERVTSTADTARVAFSGSVAELLRVGAPYGIDAIVSHEPDLEDIFLSYYEGDEEPR